ncbi:hypothetical protein N9980_00540 [bacterium]|nr:hypothetical protein [bacterium]
MMERRVEALDGKFEKLLDAVAENTSTLSIYIADNRVMTEKVEQQKVKINKLEGRLDDQGGEIVDLKINQGVFKDVKATVGKILYIIGGGFASLMVGISFAVIKLI